MAIGQELLNVPMGDMIRQMALAIAEGQMKLDASSIEVAEMMGGLKAIYDEQGDLTFDDSRVFFGYDLMTIAEAEAYIATEEALQANSAAPIREVINRQKTDTPNDQRGDALIRVPTRLSMLELGFTPTFYQFVDTIIEVKIAIKITRDSEATRTTKDTRKTDTKFGVGGGVFGAIFGGPKFNTDTVTTSQVDATYTSKYGYSAEGSSLLRTKLVPLPPPAVLEERIRRQLDEDVERRRRLLDARLPRPAQPVT